MSHFIENEWIFSREPIIVTPDLSYIDELDDDCFTDEEDFEYCINSSWYHRARLGDENRLIYRDELWDQEWIELEQKAIDVNNTIDDDDDDVQFYTEECVQSI